jgi:cell division septation protein DedD
MSDIRAGKGSTISDDDRLPWLEAVEEEDDRDGPSAAKLIAFVLIGLVAIGLIVGGLFWMGSRSGGDPSVEGGELIAAPADDYKVKPDQPGGMEVEGKGDTAFAASAGQDPQGRIDMGAVPEQPVAATPRQQPQAQAQAQPKAGRQIEVAVNSPAQRPAAAQPSTPAPAAAPAAAVGPGLQLGAFSSLASANNAWKNLSGRFKYLEPLTHSVVPVQSGGKTLYRLRASGGDLNGICSRLRVAGESCVQMN